MSDYKNDAPPCPLCQAETELKFGPYGPFYGCTKWDRNDPTSCVGAIKVKPPKVLLEAVLASVEVEVPWRWVDLSRIDAMGGTEFERTIVGLFTQAGSRPEHTGGSGDFGADVVLRAPNSGLWVIQTKCWGQRVGSRAVSEVIGAREFYHADHAAVITNQGFTKAAMEWVPRTGVELWGRGTLATVIRVLEFAAEYRKHKASVG